MKIFCGFIGLLAGLIVWYSCGAFIELSYDWPALLDTSGRQAAVALGLLSCFAGALFGAMLPEILDWED